MFTECKCNLQGSKNNKCRPDSGKCECKDGYSGIHCDFDFPIGSINLIVGGKDSEYVTVFNDAQMVDLSNQTRSCNNLAEYPIAISSATGAFVHGHPVICGGRLERGSYYSECYRHNKASDSWTFLTNMSTKRYTSASVPVNGMLLVMGGYDGSKRLATTEYISPDGDASQPGPDLPKPRSTHCAVKLSNGQVMLLGGHPDTKSAIIFHPDTETFDQSLPSMIHDRSHFGCALFNSPLHDNREVVLAVGGRYQATAEVLDYTQPNQAWTEITELPIEYVDTVKFHGARAVTSASGHGAIVQHNKYFYELKCEISGCSWSILQNQLNPGVRWAVMMTLPVDYNC